MSENKYDRRLKRTYGRDAWERLVNLQQKYEALRERIENLEAEAE